MEYGELNFRKIDLNRHSEIAIEFRADSFLISFGSDKDFWGADGLGGQRYVDWIKKQNPKKFGAFHVWKKGEIIGQIELGLFRQDEEWGYVNLYYLKDGFRGRGYSEYLDHFAIGFFKNLGINKAKLSVSPSNVRAIKFYEKQGWRDKGPRPFKGRRGHTLSHSLHFMEKIF